MWTIVISPESLQRSPPLLWSVLSYWAVSTARSSRVDIFVVYNLHLSTVLIGPIARCYLIFLDDRVSAILPIAVWGLFTCCVGVGLDQARSSILWYELEAFDLLVCCVATLHLLVPWFTSRAALVPSPQGVLLGETWTPLLKLDDLVVIDLLVHLPNVSMLKAELELAISPCLQACLPGLLLLILRYNSAQGVRKRAGLLYWLLAERGVATLNLHRATPLLAGYPLLACRVVELGGALVQFDELLVSSKELFLLDVGVELVVPPFDLARHPLQKTLVLLELWVVEVALSSRDVW